MTIFKFFSEPLSWIMGFFYNIFESVPFNYTITLIVFTIIIKALLFPLSIKQQKSTAKMAVFQPKIKELQKKYANNKQKLQEETMKLYTEEGYSPLSGCLPLLLQFPILFGLIYLIYEPLTYILRFSSDIINNAIPIAEKVLNTSLTLQNGIHNSTAQISVINAFHQDPSAFSTLGTEFVEKISKFDLNFFGINLGSIPTLEFTSLAAILLMIIPILSGVSSFIVSYFSMKFNSRATGNEIQGFTKGMLFIMPIFSLIISFQFPVGVSFYWILSNILMLVQTIILNKIWDPKELVEKAKQQDKSKKSKNKNVNYTNLSNDNKSYDNEENQKESISQKELNKNKLSDARKRYAEKYGEEYIEDSEEN